MVVCRVCVCVCVFVLCVRVEMAQNTIEKRLFDTVVQGRRSGEGYEHNYRTLVLTAPHQMHTVVCRIGPPDLCV
jgi:hypothetical protein